MEFMGYDVDSANQLGEDMFGESWCLQDVLDGLKHCWDFAIEEAKLGQGCSSKNIKEEHKLLVLREFVYWIDKETGLSTRWYDFNRSEQMHVNNFIDDLWHQHHQREEAMLDAMREEELMMHGASA